MDGHRNPDEHRAGKLLRLPLRRLGRGLTDSELAKADAVRDRERRQHLAAVWLEGIWVALAWMVAVSRLRLAISQREVFDVETSMAFLVAVLLPLLRAHAIFTTLGEGLGALRRRLRRKSAPAGAA